MRFTYVFLVPPTRVELVFSAYETDVLDHYTKEAFGGMKMCTSPLGFLQPHRVGLAGFDYCDLTVAKIALVLMQPNTVAFLLNSRPSHLYSHAT